MSIRCNFNLDSFTIMNTRSRHEDTVYVSASVAIENRPAVAATRAMGDLNNGTYGVGFVFENIEIGKGETAVFSYAIVNSGHEDQTFVEQQLQKAAVNLASTAASQAASKIPYVGPVLGPVAEWLVSQLGGVIFANCDGPVAAGLHVFTIDDIQKGTAGGVQPIRFNDDQPGIDSPTGCGSNSHYSVAGSVSLAGASAGIDMPYSGAFAKTNDNFVSCWGYARSDFDVFVKEHVNNGYMPILFRNHVVPHFVDGGWAVIMCKTTNAPPFTWLYGYARKDFDNKTAEFFRSGYRAASITAHQGLSNTSWNAVFVKDGENAPCVWGYTRADFDAKNAEFQRQGFALDWVQAVTGTDGEPYWIGIWRRGLHDQNYVYGWARQDFDQHAADMQRQGYRVVLINGYWGSDGGVEWNGIWKRDGISSNAVWGWARSDFDHEVRRNSDAGMKLVGLDC